MKVKFIPIETLLEMKENNAGFRLVEVLSEDSFAEGHIPGAINMPADRIKGMAGKMLKKTDTIVVYCGGYHCPASTNAAKILMSMGYKKVLDYKAGKKGWKDAGLELEK
ncbi:MAG TPA: rhodanese-like domain-containing protein [Nanoarchaeota archaeon]|nr:rhodanese-like domain-containing protein [Nanoarchaeota archaeon]